MSNFQELQAFKYDWHLNDDEALSEKMNYMQDNVLASSHLITASMDELNRAISAAGTTLNNAINAFNQLNYSKFMENVVEDPDEADERARIEKLEEKTAENEESFVSEMLIEKDKITFALELAIAEVTRKKKNKAEEGDDDPNSSQAEIQMQKKRKQSGYLGVASSIKLPFVIGQPEYARHPQAGLVYLGTQAEQLDHYQDEQAQRRDDKAAEQANLDENAARVDAQDQDLEAKEELKQIEQVVADNEALNAAERAQKEAEEAAKYINIPVPPEEELKIGEMAPPEGQNWAYCPGLRDGKILCGRNGIEAPNAEQIATQVQAQAQGGQPQQQDAAIPINVIPNVQADQIPVEIRQQLAQAGMPIEQMTNEARMSIKIMTMPKNEPEFDAEGASMKQRAAQLQAVMAKAGQMQSMSQGQQQQEVQQQIAQNPLAASQIQQRSQQVQQVSDDPYTGGVLGPRLTLRRAKKEEEASSMWDESNAQSDPMASAQSAPILTPQQQQQKAAQAPLKRDLTALMYGGDTPLFDVGAIENADESSDEEDFLSKLKNPSRTPMEPAVSTAGATGGAKKKAKSNNPFGSSSSDDDDDYSSKAKIGGGYQGGRKKDITAFLKEENDSEEEKFVPVVQKIPAPKKKPMKALISDDDDEEDDAMFNKKKPAAQKQAAQVKATPTPKAPVKKNKLLDSDDDDSDDDLKVATPKPTPQAKPVAKKQTKLFGSDEDDDDSDDGMMAKKIPTPAPKSVLKAPQQPMANKPAARKSTVKFMDVDSDEDDEDEIVRKPTAPAPAKPVAKVNPPAPVVRDSMASSRASENIRDTQVVQAAPPAPAKQATPPVVATQAEGGEPKKKSIKELAALINPATLGGNRKSNVSRQTVSDDKSTIQPQDVGGVTSDGDLDHMNFASKPVTKKRAQKSNAFFSDSDEDSEDSKPVAKVAPKKVAAPVVVAQKVIPQPEPVVQQDAAQTQQFWGDGQWHYDDNGAAFFYSEDGAKSYYQENDYGEEDPGFGQDYAQSQFAQLDRQDNGMAQTATARRSSKRLSGQSDLPQGRPSMPSSLGNSQRPSIASPSPSKPQMQSVPEENEDEPIQKASSSVMNQRATAMAAATKTKKKPTKSKFDDSDDENESSSEEDDSDSGYTPPPKPKQATAAPVQAAKPTPVQAAKPTPVVKQVAKPSPAKKGGLFGDDDEEDGDSDDDGNTFMFKRPGAAAAKKPAPAKPVVAAKKKKMFESSDEDDY